jgi:hypothetical protein
MSVSLLPSVASATTNRPFHLALAGAQEAAAINAAMRFVLVCSLLATLTTLPACAPPPLPSAQTAKGVKDASITLPAQSAPLKAKLQASSKAEVKDGGWVELRIYANNKECTWDQVARQPPMGPGFSVMLNCEAEVPASTPFTFRVEQVDRDAVTREVVIEATYVR